MCLDSGLKETFKDPNFYLKNKYKMWFARDDVCSVRVGVIHHEPGPLRHLAEVAVRVVEVLHGGQVGLGAQHDRELEAGLVAEDAGEDGDVAGLVKHGLATAVAGSHVADDLIRAWNEGPSKGS